MNGFLDQMRKHVAYVSVGPSTVRGQRTPGLVTSLRELLADVDLAQLATCGSTDFPNFLDGETERIERRMLAAARYWGIARKVLNIFLRAATYNHFLRDQFSLDRVESCLELPMDSLTANGLKARSQKHLLGRLPRWKGVRHLTPAANHQFQERATRIAELEKTLRVHLDIYLWLERG